ncbi:hypothetical protein FBU59_002759, partial [Linderina macrospora]
MARKSKRAGSTSTPKEQVEPAAPAQESVPVQQSSEGSDAGTTGQAAAEKSSVLTAAILKKLRNYRKKLQRAEQIEQKKESGGEINADQLQLIAKKEQYQLLVKELGELHQLSLEQDTEMNSRLEQAIQNVAGAASESIAETHHELTTGILADEALVHKQMLRLFSATSKLPKTGEQISDDSRAALQGFYRLVVLSDEKDAAFAEAGVGHVRALAKGTDSLVQELGGSITYSDVAKLIDQVLAAELVEKPAAEEVKGDADDEAGEKEKEVEEEEVVVVADEEEAKHAAATKTELTGFRVGVVTAKDDTEYDGVRMPKMPSVYVDSAVNGGADSDFVTKVMVPPGGLTFMTFVDMPEAPNSEQTETKD